MTRWIKFVIFCAPFFLSQAGWSDSVFGQVTFVQRHTIVPLCTDPTLCPKSEPYWALVITDARGPSKYEVSQIFAKASEAPPDFVELAGVQIPEGAIVFIEGEVEPVRDGFAYVSHVSRVKISDP